MNFRRGLSAAAFACATTSCTAPPQSATPAPRAAPTSDPPHGRRRTLDRGIASAITQVVRLRHLALEAPLKTQIVNRDALVRRALEELDVGFPAAVAAATSDIFYALGLVNSSFDYRRETAALLGHELGGLYVGRDRTLYVDAGLHGDEGRAALAHEIVHAIQDQHFGLDRFAAWHDDATDVESAAHAFAEGEATSVMFDAILERSGKTALDIADDEIIEDIGSGESTNDATQPGVLARSLVAPYVDGTLFVHRLRRAGGWAAVNSVWSRLPESTEQLLHADKWASREAPESVPIPLPADATSRVLYHDVLGEQGVRIVVAEWNTPTESALAASDWSGDRIAVFADGDQRSVAWHIRYDSPDASARGFKAFTRSPNFSRGTALDLDDARCAERADRGLIAIVVAGRELTIVSGPLVRGYAVVPSGRCDAAVARARAVAAQQ